jgi:orotate phosphoribosyltransferase
MQRIQRQSEAFALRYAEADLGPRRGPHWQAVVDALRDIGGRYREEPVTLKDGRQTHVYLDPKHVFSSGRHMNNMAKAMLEHADNLGIDYNAVGGPTMGADVISHAMVAHSPNPDLGWYTVRDKAKAHGLGKWIEGTELGPGHNVILTDDVADSGKSLIDAYHKVRETGANVAAVMPIVERGDKAGPQFEAMGVPYHPLVHYNDLGIKTLSQGPPPSSRWNPPLGPPGGAALANPPRGPMHGYPGAPKPAPGGNPLPPASEHRMAWVCDPARGPAPECW